jgi:hypothetical protein
MANELHSNRARHTRFLQAPHGGAHEVVRNALWAARQVSSLAPGFVVTTLGDPFAGFLANLPPCIFTMWKDTRSRRELSSAVERERTLREPHRGRCSSALDSADQECPSFNHENSIPRLLAFAMAVRP